MSTNQAIMGSRATPEAAKSRKLNSTFRQLADSLFPRATGNLISAFMQKRLLFHKGRGVIFITTSKTASKCICWMVNGRHQQVLGIAYKFVSNSLGATPDIIVIRASSPVIII